RVKHQARHGVPPWARRDVDGETRRLRLTESTRRGHGHFRGVADVGDVVRRLVAARRVSDFGSATRKAHFDATAAMNREDGEHRTGVDVVVVGLQPRNRRNQIAVAAGAGRFRMVSLSSVISRLVLCTSTTGVSPVTVIVSCTPPTRISASTAMTADPLTMRFSRLTVEKPGSENVTV